MPLLHDKGFFVERLASFNLQFATLPTSLYVIVLGTFVIILTSFNYTVEEELAELNLKHLIRKKVKQVLNILTEFCRERRRICNF